MKQFTYTIWDELGIHARLAGQLAKLVKNFPDTAATITEEDQSAKLHQLMQLMGLGARRAMRSSSLWKDPHKNGTPSFRFISSYDIDASNTTVSKADLQDKPHMEFSLDFADKVCYTEKNTTSERSSGDAAAQTSP